MLIYIVKRGAVQKEAVNIAMAMFEKLNPFERARDILRLKIPKRT